jgi:CTD small phosphatase-like protein 2
MSRGKQSIATRSLSTSTFKPDQIMSDGELSKKENEEMFKDALSTLPYRHLIYSPKLDIEKFKKHLTMTYKGLLYAVNSLRSPSEKFIKSKQVPLPDPAISKVVEYTLSHTLERAKTLALDLDETLIHACSSKDLPDAVLSYQSTSGDTTKVI